jgi:hypothetical protein
MQMDSGRPLVTPATAACSQADLHRAFGRNLHLTEAHSGAADRQELETFVADAFLRRHDATVQSFMPTLLSFRDGAGTLRGVIGLRGASEQSLYLEHYLEQPVEAAMALATGRPVDRREIVEAGNLAGSSCRTAMRMVALLPAYLLTREYRWIVFTATAAVRNILQGFGAPLVELARADGARVSNGPDRWGRYYDSDPRVLAGYLPASRRIPGFSRTA